MNAKPEAVVLVDPLSSGCELARYIAAKGFVCVRMDTIPEQARTGPLGPFLPSADDFPHTLHWPIDYDPFLQEGDNRSLLAEADELAAQISRTWRIIAVIPGSEVGVQLSDFLAVRLDCHSNAPDLVRSRRHKGDMKSTLAKVGLAHAKFSELRDVNGISDTFSKLGCPLVIKTPCGSGTSLVSVCETESDADAAVREVLFSRDFFGGRAAMALAEASISGVEYAVNMFGDGNQIHVTDVWRYEKISRGKVHNIYYCDWYEPHPPPELRDYAMKAARAIGVTLGPLHAEIRISLDGPVLMEIAARFAGGHMPHMLRELGNFDVFAATLDVFLNGTTHVQELKPFSDFVAIVSCSAIESFARGEIVGLDTVRSLPSYYDHAVNEAALRPVRPTVDTASCPLLVWLRHPSSNQLQIDVQRVHSLITIKQVS